ncbi:MAG: Co2+/Mg2+ efflux protein ApaG [Thermoanaerobaculia bacterium]
MSDTVTQGIRIRVESYYLADRSSPLEGYYLFSYRVAIANEGAEVTRLVSREWIITDANGNEQRVTGPGVVGQQPLLQPGESFEYTSFCPLPTSMGSMHGSYQMETEGGARFDALISPFTLAVPGSVN